MYELPERFQFPAVKDPDLVGSYAASANAGGGYVWDEVLEYRVWCHPESGAPDLDGGNDYYYPFDTYEDAFEFSKKTKELKARWRSSCCRSILTNLHPVNTFIKSKSASPSGLLNFYTGQEGIATLSLTFSHLTRQQIG